MRIGEAELAKRYHVLFNEEESDYLRAVGFFRPESAACTDMWMTVPELELLKGLYPTLEKQVDEAVKKADLQLGLDLLTRVRALDNFDKLQQVISIAESRAEELRGKRERPCKWGKCNGIILGNKCNRCGQVYSITGG